MNFIDFGTKTLSCGTIMYSYKLCTGGYMIKITNLSTDSEIYSAGPDVSPDYIPTIMRHLMDNDVTAENLNEFLIDELNEYFELHPPKGKRTQNKYLYL